MSTKIKINFKFDENEIKSINFDIKITVKEMLTKYLEETVSIKSLNTNDILFIYGGLILNTQNLINESIEKVFNRQKKTITGKEKKRIIGGLNLIDE